MTISRRQFLGSAASAAVVGSAAVGQTALPQPPLAQFSYSSVHLLDGPLKKQFDENHRFFLNLSEDRLLKIYRQRAGLPAPGENMGGWYDDFCPGAHFGQYVSALARFAAATGSEPTRAKVQRLIRGYSQTIDPSGKFFVDLRYPSYTYDKLVCMLMDAHSLLGEQSARPVLQATTDAALPHMEPAALTGQQQKTWRPYLDETHTWDEPYTIAENLFIVSERMNEPRYFALAKRYLQDEVFFNPLAQGQNVLPGLHAYSHMNALSSGMQAYLKLHDPKYFRAVSNAVNMIWAGQSFATGGWGPNESFVEPDRGLLGASLHTTHRSFETPCGSYAHFKVMRYLMMLTRDSRYGDSMERVLYNTVLGAKPIQEDGRSFYYSDYHASGEKTYKRDIAGAKYSWDHDGRWPCCSGTLPQVSADYVISTYFRDGAGIAVNLFVPSRATWVTKSARCTLTQQTSYPAENLVTLRLQLTRSAEFPLSLRVPEWAGSGTTLSINGKRLTSALPAGRFLSLRRTWNDGDLIEFEIDQRCGSVPVDRQTPNQVAFVRGPQVLFAISGSPRAVLPQTAAAPQLTRSQDLHWTLREGPGQIVLRPFYAIGEEQYQTYSPVAARG